MTREEAIKAISDMILDMEYPNGVYHEKFTEDESQKHLALYAVKKALRPVSREQVEKVFPGCPYCKPDSEGYVQKFGAYSILNGELKTGHCKPQKISFCPHCSRPLTDEAVEMVMERLEALKDGRV